MIQIRVPFKAYKQRSFNLIFSPDQSLILIENGLYSGPKNVDLNFKGKNLHLQKAIRT